MLSILLVSKTGGTYENEKNKSSGAGTDHDSVWCGICKGNAGGSEGAVQEKLSGEVFRFHVLANSDSKEDQELKMKVKEAVVDYMCENLSNAGNAAEAKAWAIRHKEELIRTVREVLQKEGCNDQITAEVVRCEFPDKTYGDITFPAGWYDALRIKIGKAQGHNWWCVLYPNLCFMDSVHAIVPKEGKEELRSVLTDEEYAMIVKGTPVKIKWFFLQLTE